MIQTGKRKSCIITLGGKMSIRVGKANGKGTCGECKREIPKGEKQLIEETYMNSMRRCKNCFLKVFGEVFSEELQSGDEKLLEKFKAIIMLNNLEEKNDK